MSNIRTTTRRLRPFLVAGGLLLGGCSPTALEPLPTPQGCDRFALVHRPASGGTHLADCASPGCGNGLNPPTGGPHCGSTAFCRRHQTPQPRCSWLHNLEHGQVVLAYNCPEGCPELVDRLDALRLRTPPGPNGVPRALLTPDPELPARVAALVWGYAYTGEDLDQERYACLLSHQDEEAPEPFLSCSQ